MFQIIST